MLRAISEMAAAITVWSPLENPVSAPDPPALPGGETSTSAAIGISSSSARSMRPFARSALDAELRLVVEEQEAFLEISAVDTP